MRKIRTYLLTILFITLNFSLIAQTSDDYSIAYKQVIQDAFLIDLVYPQEKNEIQLSVSPTMLQHISSEEYIFPMGVEYGINDSWQIGVEWNVFRRGSSVDEYSSNRNLQLGTKYSFMNIANSPFHSAIGLEMGLPINKDNFGLDEKVYTYEACMLFAYDLSKINNAQLFAQMVFEYEREVAEEKDDYEVELGMGFFIPMGKIVFLSELTWNSTIWNTELETECYYSPALLIDLPGTWETGFAFPIGLNSNSDKYRFSLRLTYEFGIKNDDE